MDTMELFVGEGSKELFDPSFRQQILVEIVGCMGLASSNNADARVNMRLSEVVSMSNNSNMSRSTIDLTNGLNRVEDSQEKVEDGCGEGGDNNVLQVASAPVCVVKLARMIVHRTKPVTGLHYGNPIWTIQTGSLFVLQIPNEKAVDETIRGSPRFVLGRSEMIPALSAGVTFEFLDGGLKLGYVTLTLDQVRDICENQPSERLEVDIVPARGSPLLSKKNPAILAIRMRYASTEDLIFMGKHPPPEPPPELPTKEKRKHHLASTRDWSKEAGDMEFKEVRAKSIFQQYKKMNGGTKLYRVMPGPDPTRPPEATEWMSSEQIQIEALKPSHHFVHTGTGQGVGKVYVEILGATNLPNMDLSVNCDDRTDPFVAMVFEDCMVRTDMLWDNLNPNWMPWTMRAFCFHMRHPNSLLLLGMFDYDDSPLDSHDSVGRIVISVANFYPNTTYLLHYSLHDHPRFTPEDNGRGQIMIRMRVEWDDNLQVQKLMYTAPPKCIINCKTDKTFQVLRYLKRGPLDMEQPSVDSIKVFAGEVKSYWIRYCHFLDILFEIFLWRGRLEVPTGNGKTKKIWFPHHSIALSAAVLLSLEYLHLIGPIFLYAVAWVLLTVNFHNSRHPNPWKRVKRWTYTNFFFMRDMLVPKNGIVIEPHTGVEEGAYQDKLDRWRGERMSQLVSETLTFCNKIYQIYSTTSVTAKFFSTNQHVWSLLGDKLAYPHMFLRLLCKYSRVYLTFINWDGNAANGLVMRCLVLATLWLFLPVNLILLWVGRVLAWTLFGPWMKLLDVYFVHSWYRTSDELFELIQEGVEERPVEVPNYDIILQSGWLANLSYHGRLASEDALKLKDMREYRFGRYCELIPVINDSRYPSVPLPQSKATPYDPNNDDAKFKKPVSTEDFVVCQKLQGSMIMEHVKDFTFLNEQETRPPPPAMNGTGSKHLDEVCDFPPKTPPSRSSRNGLSYRGRSESHHEPTSSRDLSRIGILASQGRQKLAGFKFE